MPALIPPTTPLEDPTVPIAVLLLLHVPIPPDAVASVKVIVTPVHTDVEPVIAPATGVAFTVTTYVAVTVPHDTLDTV